VTPIIRRKLIRIALAVALLSGGFLLLPRPASRVLAPDANAQIIPTPSLPPVLPSPKPSPTPEVPEPDDDPGDPGTGGGGDDGGGSTDGGGTGTDGSGGTDGGGDKDGKDGNGAGDSKGDGKGRDGKGTLDTGGFSGEYHIAGTFSTNKLVAAASELRSLEVPVDQIISKVYPPFIIAGESAWTDTWGAPRYGPGPIVRTHEGQDVFCKYGDPILSPEAGTMSYSDGGLGGITARVHTSSTSYWYLTHLSATNAKEHPSGSSVEVGDVVGYCGNSGNAATTPPHVHFGWYVNGVAQNPMRHLVKWLHEAERRVLGEVTVQQRKKIKNAPSLTLERRFGDGFAPDLSTLEVSGESLWATGSSPATGAFALAEVALQAALAGGSTEDFVVSPVEAGDGESAAIDEGEGSNGLSDLLQGGLGYFSR
jgi:hypothetical protein